MKHAKNCPLDGQDVGEWQAPHAEGQPETAACRTERITAFVQPAAPGIALVSRRCTACGTVENATVDAPAHSEFLLEWTGAAGDDDLLNPDNWRPSLTPAPKPPTTATPPTDPSE